MSNTDSVTEVAWDPFNAPANPYSTYAAMRDHAPVHHNAERDIWALTRFDDVQAANRDWQTFSYAQGTLLDGIGDHFQPGNFLDHDPPLHTQLRAAVKDKFTVSILRDTYSALIDREVDELLKELTKKDEFDFAIDLAWVLPIYVGSHILGFPQEDIPRLRDIADQAFAVNGEPGSGEASAAAVAVDAIRQYFVEQIEDRRRHPKDDLLTQIANASVDGKPIGDSAAGVAALIFGGSVDSTALAMTSVIDLLGKHPEQREWLIKNPELTEQAVEETFRFESPVQFMKRTTTRDVEMYDTTIPAGSAVCLMFGAANRDPRKFERADEFDATRKFSRHIAFGDGVHHCIGAPIARIEATTVVRKFLELVPNFEVVDSWKIGGSLCGFRNLKIKRL